MKVFKGSNLVASFYMSGRPGLYKTRNRDIKVLVINCSPLNVGYL